MTDGSRIDAGVETLSTVVIFKCCRMDADIDTYDNEAAPDIRLKDGLDIRQLQLGEAQEFEVAEEDDNHEQNGRCSF